MGEKGGASWDPPGLFSDENNYMVNTEPNWLPNSDAFGAKMRNFVDHVLYNRPMAPGAHGLMVQKMLDGIYESAAKGKEVTQSSKPLFLRVSTGSLREPVLCCKGYFLLFIFRLCPIE